MKFNARKDVSVQFQVAPPVFSIGSVLALIGLILAIVFWFVGDPDPKVALLLIALVALARLL